MARVHIIAKAFVARAEAQGMKGKRRDELALEFFLGAMTQAVANDDGDMVNVLGQNAAIISARGFSWVQEVAKHGDASLSKG